MAYENILYDLTDGVATITLNRPESLNAFTTAMIGETAGALRQCDRDPSVRCVVITGAGRGFTSGQDLAEVQGRGDEFSIGPHLRAGYHRIIKNIVNMEKPVIAAVNGVAAGAGVGIVLAADIRIASEKASLVMAFSKIGLVPDSGLNWLLPRMIGQSRAYQLAVTAERITAQQGLDWGLFNEVVPPDQLAEHVDAWAQRLATGPSVAFGLTKRAMNRAWSQTFEEALDYEAYLQDTASRTEDNQEGVAAFLEKRAPQYRGR